MRFADDFKTARRQRQIQIEIPAVFSEIVQQRTDVRIERREDQAAIGFGARRRQQSPLLQVESLVGGVDVRHARQFAGVPVSPAMIGAEKRFRVAFVGEAEPRAAMPATVEQDADDVVLAADHNERVVADRARDVVARIGNLRLMRQENPVTAKNLLELKVVKGLIVKNPKRDRKSTRLNSSHSSISY